MAGEETDACEEREGATEAQPMTDYEKERLSRIRDNEARLQALGIRRLAASPLLHPSPPAAAAKRKQKNRPAKADEEYLPSEDGGGEEESSSASDQDYDDEEEIKSSSRSRKKGKKKKLLNSGKSSKSTPRKESAPIADFVDDDAALQQGKKKKLLNSGKSSKSTPRKESAPIADFVDDDAALQQAIALSLAGPSENSVAAMGAEISSTGMRGSEGTLCKKNNTLPIQDSAKNRKIKKQGKSRIQLTEDDVVAFFFSFDEVGKGYITPWDLERMANVHDFIWTDSEISKMIHCFDSDRDGKINLEDFRTIVSRCNMLQEPGK